MLSYYATTRYNPGDGEDDGWPRPASDRSMVFFLVSFVVGLVLGLGFTFWWGS